VINFSNTFVPLINARYATRTMGEIIKPSQVCLIKIIETTDHPKT